MFVNTILISFMQKLKFKFLSFLTSEYELTSIFIFCHLFLIYNVLVPKSIDLNIFKSFNLILNLNFMLVSLLNPHL